MTERVIQPAEVGAVADAGSVPSLQSGTRLNQPAAGSAGRLYYVTDEDVIERDTGTAWSQVTDLLHRQDVANPHGVTATQAGAAPASHVGSGGTAHADVVAGGADGFMLGADKSKLDALGQTTKVSQSEAGSQSVANATWTGVSFDTEDRDDGVYYDPLSPGAVVLPAGIHLVDFYGDWDVNSTGLRVTRFLMDGVVVFTDVGTNAANVAAGRMVPNTVFVSGGTLTVEVYQSSGAALTFNRPTSTPNPYLQVVRIG